MDSIILRTHKKKEGPARAEIVRTSNTKRAVRSLVIGVGGTVFGLATILIPIAHFITTWAIPLLSIFIAIYTWRMGPMIQRIVGNCPACDADLDIAGGTMAPDLWVRCTGCNEPLHPELATPQSPEA